MAVVDKREIEIRVSDKAGELKPTFRNFLTEKGIGNGSMNVNPKVKLFSESGFKVTQGFEESNPYAEVMKMFGAAKNIGKIAALARIFITTAKYTGYAAQIASADDDGVAWVPWVENILSFKDAKPFTVQIEFKFHMGEFGLWDANEEVYKPIMNLMALFIPKGITGINIIPHLRTSTQTLYDFIRGLGRNILSSESGENIFSGFKSSLATFKAGEGSVIERADAALDGIFEGLSTGMGAIAVDTIENRPGGGFYNVDISYGSNRFLFKRLQPTTCDIEFTNKEYDDRGYPIQGSINMTFKSYQPATLAGISKNNINFGFIKD